MRALLTATLLASLPLAGCHAYPGAPRTGVSAALSVRAEGGVPFRALATVAPPDPSEIGHVELALFKDAALTVPEMRGVDVVLGAFDPTPELPLAGWTVTFDDLRYDATYYVRVRAFKATGDAEHPWKLISSDARSVTTIKVGGAEAVSPVSFEDGAGQATSKAMVRLADAVFDGQADSGAIQVVSTTAKTVGAHVAASN